LIETRADQNTVFGFIVRIRQRAICVCVDSAAATARDVTVNVKEAPTPAATIPSDWDCAGAESWKGSGEAWLMGPMRGWAFRLAQVITQKCWRLVLAVGIFRENRFDPGIFLNMGIRIPSPPISLT